MERPPQQQVAATLATKNAYVRERFLRCRDLVLEARPRSVLEVGCHDGLFLSLLGDGVETHGVDLLDPAGVAPGIAYRRHDVTAGLPHADASFDAVYAGELIEHLIDTVGFLRECRRVLRPGGRLVLSTPNLHYWRNLVEWLRGNQFFFVDYRGDQEGHVRYFCAKTLREVAREAGFEAIRTRTVGDWEGRNPLLRLVARGFRTLSRDKNLILIMDARRPAAGPGAA